MFKLTKIINSGVNVPENELIVCDCENNLAAGTAVVMDNENGVLRLGNADEKPTHILIRPIKYGDTHALCYRITPAMIFETTVNGDPKYLYDGVRVLLHKGSDVGTCGVSNSTDNGVATIYSLENAKKSGDKVLVTFD